MRKTPQLRKLDLLNAGLQLAETHGYRNVSSVMVAKKTGLKSHGIIFYHFKNMDNFKREILRHAIRVRNNNVMLQAVLLGDDIKSEIPDDVFDHIVDDFVGGLRI